MTDASRQLAGILFVLVPTVEFGGWSLLRMIARRVPGCLDNPVRQNLFRAGHAHAGVLLLLSLIALRYVDEAHLTERTRRFVRLAFPTAAVLLPLAFFLSVLTPDATAPNPLINLAYLGAAVLVAAMLTLGIGLTRAHPGASTPAPQPANKE